MARYRSGRKHEPVKHPAPPRPASGEGKKPQGEPETEAFSDGFEGSPGKEVPRFEPPRGGGQSLREIEDSPELRKLLQPDGGSNGD